MVEGEDSRVIREETMPAAGACRAATVDPVSSSAKFDRSEVIAADVSRQSNIDQVSGSLPGQVSY